MDEQEKLNEFGNASYEQWLKLVERDLEGAPFEKKLVKRVAGVDIKPLYTRADSAPDAAGLPGFAPYTRGGYALGSAEMGWDVRQEIADEAPEAAHQSALEALNGGANSLALRLDQAARAASAEHGLDGVAMTCLADLELILADAQLEKVPVALKAGASALPAAAALFALAQKRGLKLAALTGSLGADPLGTLASCGSLPTSLEAAMQEAAELATWASQHAPGLRALSIDSSPYHEAGADAATEVAVALATGLEYVRALTQAGLTLAQAASQLVFTFSIGRDVFVEIAKLRAARLTWAKVMAACGADTASQVMHIDARTSLRTKTQRDPWVNMLRDTGECFSAAVAGADVITALPFDALLGQSDDFGARMARNTQHLLRYESNVHRVVDPAGGSWYVEAITDGLARKAWEKFTSFEKAGGFIRVLLGGSLQKELAQALEAERKAVETRKLAITGVNEFPHVKEEPVARAQPDLARATQRAKDAATNGQTALQGVTFAAGKLVDQAIQAVSRGAAFASVRAALGKGTPVQAPVLLRERLAQPFETLRDAADRYAAKTGKRPSVFLANLGPIPEHKARAGFAQNYLEAGGFATIGNDGFATADEVAAAFAASGAEIVVLCSSDAVYAELAGPSARAIEAKGAKAIVLAGNPGPAEPSYREAGVTDFIFVGTNVVQALRSLLERVGAV